MKEYIISNPHELEVNIKRNPLSFQISASKNISEKTIPIVVLHGYGEYANSDYMKSVHKTLTSNYDVAIITVNYIGTFTKVNFPIESIKPYDFLDQKLEIVPGEKKKNFLSLLHSLLENNQHIIKILRDRKFITHIDFRPYTKAIDLLIYKIENKSCDGYYILERLYEMGFTLAMVNFINTTKGEHQDFGLIQAMDILTAVSHIRNEHEYLDINWSKLSIVGTSHGGYIASMCDKLAPNTFNIIVNNSGWINARKLDILPREIEKQFLTMRYNSAETNYWSDIDGDINYFSLRHQEIRSLSNLKHLNEQKSQTKYIDYKKYVFIHTLEDDLIPLEEKDAYIEEAMNNVGDFEYVRIDNQSKLDGRTFKSLKHGADASLKGLVIDFVIKSGFNEQIEKNDYDLKNIIEYKCTNGIYSINFTNGHPKIEYINS